jgi:transposase
VVIEETTRAVEERSTVGGGERLIPQVRRRTRRRFSAGNKIRIVFEGFRRKRSLSSPCRRDEISTALRYSWLKDFM